MFQLAMFVERQEATDDVLTAAARRLALHVYLYAILDAQDGDREALEWLGDAGKALAEEIGLGFLARIPAKKLVASANRSGLLEALGHEARHCRDCAELACGDGRCWCLLGMWADQGRNPEYAEITVTHDTKRFLKPCNLWEEREQ